jgi:hypothetical protein
MTNFRIRGRLIHLELPPNTACTQLRVRATFLSMFLASAESRFEGESTLPPQAGNAHRWAFDKRLLILGA